MADDWEWFWAGEGGRDRILRGEVEGLHARLASASSQTSRLSSQLANLSGSIEGRLNALSAAFDAYVELGDLREQLAAYEEPAAFRREAAAALDALVDGRPARPLDPQGSPYWLPYAMNAVIGLVEGRRDPALEQQARDHSSEADLFLVATAGVLGRGAQVAERVPSLLVSDGALTVAQVSLWRAVVAGAYGPIPDELAARWQPVVAAAPAPGWVEWVGAQAGDSKPATGISWLHGLLTGRPASGSTGPGGPGDGLTRVVTELVGRGYGDEVELLARARDLRARIEQPTDERRTTGGVSTAASSGRLGDQPAPAGSDAATVVSEVRRAVVDAATAPDSRAVLLGWVREPMTEVVDHLTRQAESASATVVGVRSLGATVPVTASGADTGELQAASARIEAGRPTSRVAQTGWVVVAAIAAVVAVVLTVVGRPGWAALLGLVTVVGASGALREIILRRSAERGVDEDHQRLDEAVASASARASTAEEARLAELSRLSTEAETVRRRLAEPVALSPSGGR